MDNIGSSAPNTLPFFAMSVGISAIKTVTLLGIGCGLSPRLPFGSFATASSLPRVPTSTSIDMAASSSSPKPVSTSIITQQRSPLTWYIHGRAIQEVGKWGQGATFADDTGGDEAGSQLGEEEFEADEHIMVEELQEGVEGGSSAGIIGGDETDPQLDMVEFGPDDKITDGGLVIPNIIDHDDSNATLNIEAETVPSMTPMPHPTLQDLLLIQSKLDTEMTLNQDLTARVAVHQAEREEMVAAIRKMRRELKDSKSDVSEMDEEMQRINETNSKLTKMVLEKRERIQLAEDAEDQLAKTFEIVQHKFQQDLDQHSSTIHDLEAEVAELRAAAIEQDEKMASLGGSYEKVVRKSKGADAKLAASEKAAEELQMISLDQETEIADLRTANSKLGRVIKQHSALQTQLEEDKTALINDVETSTITIENLRQTVTDLIAAAEAGKEADVELMQMEDQLAQLDNLAQEKERQIQELTMDCREMASFLQDGDRELAETQEAQKNEAQTNSDLLEQLTAQLVASTERVQVNQEEIITLKNAIAERDEQRVASAEYERVVKVELDELDAKIIILSQTPIVLEEELADIHTVEEQVAEVDQPEEQQPEVMEEAEEVDIPVEAEAEEEKGNQVGDVIPEEERDQDEMDRDKTDEATKEEEEEDEDADEEEEEDDEAALLRLQEELGPLIPRLPHGTSEYNISLNDPSSSNSSVVSANDNALVTLTPSSSTSSIHLSNDNSLVNLTPSSSTSSIHLVNDNHLATLTPISSKSSKYPVSTATHATITPSSSTSTIHPVNNNDDEEDDPFLDNRSDCSSIISDQLDFSFDPEETFELSLDDQLKQANFHSSYLEHSLEQEKARTKTYEVKIKVMQEALEDCDMREGAAVSFEVLMRNHGLIR